MKRRILILICLLAYSYSCFGQFYSAERRKVAKTVDVVVDDSICEDSDDDDIEESQDSLDGAAIADSLLNDISMGAVLPLKNIRVTSPYGLRRDPFTGRSRMHRGIDLYARHEYPVSMFLGKVIKVGLNNSAGNYVTLKHGSLTVSYCHLSKIYVSSEDLVVPGTIIGLTGSTGRSTGEHLHLTCRMNGKLFNPYLLIRLISSWFNEYW